MYIIGEVMIAFLFNFLSFTAPFLFFPQSSELFEFNKMIFIYMMTTIIFGFWLIDCIIQKKLILKKHFLSLLVLLFLISQTISTIFSIDPITSLFGYPSRLNGGLISIICFSILFWIFVSRMDKDKTIKFINTSLISLFLVSIWGILEHFNIGISCLILGRGIEANCWVQDVVHRIFATLGQPNWLASFIVALIPLSWSFILENKKQKNKYLLLNAVLVSAHIFTKSRSGILAFAISFLIFFIFSFKSKSRDLAKIAISIFALGIIFGTPWTKGIESQITQKPIEVAEEENTKTLDLGGTESGILRQIVWRGAFEIFKHNPIIGTGVETFAYSYYSFRPVEHNLTSEWDFLYNKAHNEFLNIAANTGIFGLATYSIFILAVIITTFKKSLLGSHYHLGILSGFIALNITNFFGFSVSITNLWFFLLPAISISLQNKSITLKSTKNKNSPIISKIIIYSIFGIIAYTCFLISTYWYSDYLYANSQTLQNNLEKSEIQIKKAISYFPFNPNYHDHLAYIYAQKALETKDPNYAKLAHQQIILVKSLSPKNVSLIKSGSNIYMDLSEIDANFLIKNVETLQSLITLAPTDPSIYHRMGISLASLSQTDSAIQFLDYAIYLKPNYKNARLLRALLLKQLGKKELALADYEYVFEFISPDDSEVIKAIEEIKKGL